MKSSNHDYVHFDQKSVSPHTRDIVQVLMKMVLIYFIIVLGLWSCQNNLEYENAVIYPNYYDSLNYISLLKEIKPIRLTDSLKNQFNSSSQNSYYDSLILNNSYLINGIQNINIIKELKQSHQLNKPLLNVV